MLQLPGEVRADLRNLAIVTAEARAKGETYPLPTLEALLTEPEFDPLRRFLAERAVPLPDLQQSLDRLLTAPDNPQGPLRGPFSGSHAPRLSENRAWVGVRYERQSNRAGQAVHCWGSQAHPNLL